MTMKRILSYLTIPALLVAAASCAPKEEIEFAHEAQAFETRSDRILVEAILPQATAEGDEVYIIGDFNGNDAAVGNAAYRLTRSTAIPAKWGVYVDPSAFQGGKTLADGFTFYNVQQGLERGPKNEDVLHKLTIGPGEWANVYADKWAKYFAPPENPDEIKLPELDGYGFFVDASEAPSYAEMALYAWGSGLSDADDLFGGWPGMQPTGTWECKGVTYVYFDLGSKTNGLTVNFIINNNNGGSQLENFDVLKNQVIDHNFFFKITDEDVTVIDDPAQGGGSGPVLPELDGYGFFVDNAEAPSYAEMALYAWGSGLSDADDLFGGWPGMQPTGTWEYQGVTYTYFDLGSKTNDLTVNFIINNNNGGSQLENFDAFKNQVIDHNFFFKITDTEVTVVDGPGGSGGGGGEEPPTPEVPNDPVTIYVQDLTGWDALNLYMWGDKELCGGWPGLTSAENTVKIGTVNYKVFTVEDALGRSENLIFNGAGGQTADIPLTLATEQFIKVEVVDGTVTGTVVDPRNPDIKILVNNKTDWDAIALYAYGDAEAFGGWPGATPVGTEEVKGVTYTVFGLPADMAGKSLNLIFNNNNGGKQLADFAITVPEEEMFLNINANYYVDNVEGNPRGEDSYIYVIDSMGWGENLHLYAWGGAEIFGGWPGAAGEYVGTFCGVPAYRFFVSAEHTGKEEHLIFNNGNGGDGNQFDGPAVNVGENLYYGISSDFTCAEAELKTRVYVEDNTGWEALYVYSWGTGEIFGGWPGAAVTGEQTIGDKTWKYAEIPASSYGWTANLIFNNNNGTQLENFDVLKGQTVTGDFFYVISADNVTKAE